MPLGLQKLVALKGLIRFHDVFQIVLDQLDHPQFQRALLEVI